MHTRNPTPGHIDTDELITRDLDDLALSGRMLERIEDQTAQCISSFRRNAPAGLPIEVENRHSTQHLVIHIYQHINRWALEQPQ